MPIAILQSQMEPRAQLSVLAPEILQIIIECAHASCHWPLAQTCQYLYCISQPILDRHRQAHQKFRIVSDLHPLTVVELLWSVFSHGAASIDAWHVREFEVWGSRTGFEADREHWAPWIVDAETGNVSDGAETVPWTLEVDDVDFFLGKIASKLPQFIGDDGHFYDTAWNEFTSGQDGFLKGLLLAHLPRLNALRFAANGSDSHSSLAWLARFAFWCTATGYWLPGLRALQKVAVGVSVLLSDIFPWDARSVPPEELPERPTFDLLGLLCLPKISDVYFSHIERHFSFDRWEDCLVDGMLPPSEKSLALKTMILDKFWPVRDDGFIELICNAAKRLNTLVIRSDSVDGRGFVQNDIGRLPSVLAEHQGPSLQRLLLYADHDRTGRTGLRGYGPDKLGGFDDLRLINILLDDVVHTVAPKGEVQTRSELLNRFIKVFREGFPERVEVMDLWQNNDSPFQNGDHGHDAEMDFLDDAVAAMINSDRYKHLKIVYVDNAQLHNLNQRGKSGNFPKATKAGEERGVHVQILGREQPQHSPETQFVVLPDRFDMLTGPFGKRDESWVLDRFRGSLARPRSEEWEEWEEMEF